MSQDPQCSREKFEWQLNTKIIVFSLVLFPLLIVLGFWQLERAEEKRSIVDEFRLNQQAPPATLEDLLESSNHQYRSAWLTGTLDGGRRIFLDNRVKYGRPGYEVVEAMTVLGLNVGTGPQLVLVNRGWVAASLDRRQLPQIETVVGEVQLRGSLYRNLRGGGSSSSSSGSNSSNNQGNGAMNADNDEEAKRNASEFAERLGANFHDAQRVFQLTSSNNSSDHSFLKGVRLAKDVQMAVIRQGVAVIQQRLLRNAGKFRYAYLSTMSDGDLNFFKRPPLLSKLAHWLIKALPHTKKRVASNNLPIVLCVLDEERQVYICVGTPGPNEIKNRFGQAFRKAADLIEVRYKHDSFTSSVIEIEKEHVMNFTDQLYLTLENMDRRRLPQRNVRQRTSFEDTAGQDGSEDAGMDNVGHGVLDESLQAIE